MTYECRCVWIRCSCSCYSKLTWLVRELVTLKLEKNESVPIEGFIEDDSSVQIVVIVVPICQICLADYIVHVITFPITLVREIDSIIHMGIVVYDLRNLVVENVAMEEIVQRIYEIIAVLLVIEVLLIMVKSFHEISISPHELGNEKLVVDREEN